jgi:hypothetical protein
MADPLTEFILFNHKVFIVCCFILFVYFAGLFIIFILKYSGLIFNRQFEKIKENVFKKVHNINHNISNNYQYLKKKYHLKNTYQDIKNKNKSGLHHLQNLSNKMYYEMTGNYKKVDEYDQMLKTNRTMLEYDNLNEKDYLYIIIWVAAFIIPIIAFIAGQIVRIQLCALFWIFVNWLLIKMLVPLIIIFPIPIIPYVFILPLQIILLEIIPPFKILTELGTLPLLYRIFTRLIDPNVFNNYIVDFIGPNVKDIGEYLFYHVRNLGKQYATDLYGDKQFDNKGEEIVKKDNENIANISGTKQEDEEAMKKYQEYKETDNVKSSMDKIDEDTQICIGLNQDFKPYGASYSSEVSADMGNSINPYSKCYAAAIKSYIKTSIAPPP